MSSAEREPQVTSWRRAAFCGTGECVEVAARDGLIMVRDSKDPDGAILRCSEQEWLAFVSGIKSGEFDDVAGASRQRV